jgi:ketosteroid isomerase-like protein
MTNVEVVKQCYEKFRQGDGAGLLAMFDPNMEFRLAEGHPYKIDGKPWIGREEILQNFLMKAGGEWDNWDVAVLSILEAPDAVVVECRYSGTYKPTDRKMDIQVCHVWKIRNGTPVSFHQYADTAGLQKVMGYGEADALAADDCAV